MTFQEIVEKLNMRFPAEAFVKVEETIAQLAITLHKAFLTEVCQFLFETEGMYFDFLSCLTAVDNGIAKDSMEIIYHLYSIPYNHSLVLKVELPRTFSEENKTDFVEFDGAFLPQISTVTNIWRSANWHEREAFDLMGVWFEGHPDLRRILLPADWKGHPLRKDYVNLETYHGIKVAY
jgi:NADH-quinone oxidoreductase subunit C